MSGNQEIHAVDLNEVTARELGRHHAQDAFEFAECANKGIVISEVYDPLDPTDSWFVGKPVEYACYIEGFNEVCRENGVTIPSEELV
jgi:hypothetical protein